MPPKYSDTSAMITASGAAVRMAVKKYGNEFGRRTLASTCRGVAAYERISSTWVASFCRSPFDTCTNTTKNTAIVTMMRRPI